MNVAFWSNFSKRKNSTKRPSGSGTVYDCILKDSTSIMRPKIALKWTGNSSPVTLSYATIGSFGNRCYFVADWTYEDRQWVATLEEDVLGSFQSSIATLNKYVIRSGGSPSAFNAGTPDSFFPAGFDHDDNATSVSITGWAADPGAGGDYVVGIIGNSNSGLYQCGGAAYGRVTAADLNTILSSAFTSRTSIWSGTTPTTIQDALVFVGETLVKSIFNPGDYILSAMWFPFSVNYSSTGVTPELGYIPCVGATMYGLTAPKREFHFVVPTSGLFGDGKEPNLYIEPYCSYYLEFWPFGVFPINGRTLVSSTTQGIAIDVTVDVITGTARFEAYRSTSSTYPSDAYKSAYLCGGSAKLGVELPISGAKSNAASGLGQLISTVGAAASASSGWGVAAALGSGALNVSQAIAPTASSGGACSGFAGIKTDVRLHKTRFTPAGLDYAELGKAYAQKVVLATIPGFIQCWDGDFDTAGASIAEREEISSYLTGGFFYE